MRKVICWLVPASLLFALVLEGGRLGFAGLDLQKGVGLLHGAAQALGTTPEGWTDAAIGRAAGQNREAAGRLERGDRMLRGDPVMRLAGQVPYLRDQSRALLALSAGATAGTRAFDDLLDVATAYRTAAVADAAPGPRLLAFLGASGTALENAGQVLRPAVAELRASVAARTLVPPLRHRVQDALGTLTQVAGRASDGAAAARNAPLALGAVGPRSYLLLFNNPSEERPGGGYTGALGSVRVANGTPAGLAIHEQGYYTKAAKQRLPVPYPLSRYLKFYRDSLELGDAGWNPDFPTSARVYEQLFTSASQQTVDGTIALDPYAVAAFLGVTGPVDVAHYGRFTSADFFPRLNEIVNASGDPTVGLQALAPISQAVLQRIVSSPVSEWPRLLETFQQQAAERHIQLSLHDPALAASARQVHWDGGLVQTKTDFLMVVDANVGATKGDYFVKKRDELSVSLLRGGVVQHSLHLRYTMPAPVNEVDRALNPAPGDYVDYVRIYIPQSARVERVSYSQDGGRGDGGLDTEGTEDGRRYVAVAFRLPRGHSGDVELTYDDPGGWRGDYSIYLQKEAGSVAIPVDLVLTAGGRTRRVASDLTTDRQLQFAL